ncbi:hypothetical protein P3S67_017509 [Capsicum chacoense]
MDGEVRKQFQRALEKQKMKFMLQTKVVSVDITGDGVKLTLKPAADGHQTTLEADVVLVSAGRVSFTSEPGLDMIGVETDKVCVECWSMNVLPLTPQGYMLLVLSFLNQCWLTRHKRMALLA